MRRGRNYNDRE